jgi:hypothetical protein
MHDMDDKGMDELLTGLREEYNSPPDTPREEMWSVIQSRLVPKGELEPGAGHVVSLEEARRSRDVAPRRALTWALGAAALVVLGLGIGRITAPGAGPGPKGAEVVSQNPEVLRAAAVDHLLQTESLLTMVRADARTGSVAPGMGSWAQGLLTQTRLLMDAHRDSDPAMTELLEDLELVLVQIVGATGASENDPARIQSELNLALGGLNEREVLPRIQAVIPAGPRFVGT